MKPNRQRILYFVLLLLLLLSACAPPPPPYPSYRSREEVVDQAQQISQGLEEYVQDWLDGKVPARIPDKLLPKGINTAYYKNFYLQKYEEINPKQQWAVRSAHQIDFNAIYGAFPDPHATYLVLGVFYAPFGSKMVIEGEFPHSRFFDIQATPSFYPEVYRYDGWGGVGEVPIVDVDIEPLPGNINPFRVGADRNANNRRYRVTFDLAVGNPVELNPAFQPPYYRGPGNYRVGGAILYQGPWGNDPQYGHHRGSWDIGQLWIRYYAPDEKYGSLAGVSLPKVYYQLPDGRKYFINADWTGFNKHANQTKAAPWSFPEEPRKSVEGPQEGWDKMFGIFRNIAIGIARYTGCCDRKYVRDLDRGVTGRGEEMPPPGNYEASATTCTYINYFGRAMSLGAGKILVLSGKLPTFPSTRNSEPQMTTAQARYWSISSYGIGLDPDGYVGPVYTSVMDDELILDSERRYIIVYSRESERPQNATAANGVTWVNWGPVSRQALLLRWLSIYPEWSFSLTPHEFNLPWASGWASANYNKKLVGNNSHDGFLGPYLPNLHYLSKSQFEALGSSLSVDSLPRWR